MATEVAEAPVPLAEAAPDAAAEAPAAAAATGDAKPAKARKPAAPRKRANSTHPPYAEVTAQSFPVLALLLFVLAASRLDLTGSCGGWLVAQMISEAITSLKERTGSSQYAIAKFVEDKQKAKLPPNFRKLLLVQLKKLVAAGKLTKVKNSYKLPAGRAPAAACTSS